MDKTELLPLLDVMSTQDRALLEVSEMADEGELTVSKEASYQSMEEDSLRHRGSGSPPVSPTDDFIQIQVRRRGREERERRIWLGATGLAWGGGEARESWWYIGS